MQTSYEVGAVLRLIDEASPVLRLLSEKMEAFDKLVANTSKSLNRLGQTRIGELGGSITSVSEKLSRLGTGAEGAASKIKGSFQNIATSATEAGQRMAGFELAVRNLGENTSSSFSTVTANVTKADEAIVAATGKASGLAAALREAGAASRDIPRLPSPRSGGGGGGGSHQRPGAGGGDHEGGHPRNSFGSHGAYIDAGMLGMIGGHEVTHAVTEMVEAGAKLEKFQAQLQAATGDMAKVADATAAAWAETGKNLTTNVGDNLKNLQHLMNVVGSLDEAKSMLHPFTQVDTALGSIKDDSVAGGKGSKALELNAYNVARSLEQLGVTQDEEKLNSYVSSITRMMIGMRGLVDGSKLYNTINNAGGARYAWDQDFVTNGLGPLTQATNGRAGAQLYQLNRSFYQGVSTKMMAEGAEKYGLWKEEDEVYEGGKFKGMKVGSVFEADKLMHNPVAWAGDVRTMMKGNGVAVDDTDVMTKVIAESTRGNKNLGAIMDELLLPNAYKALMKERGNIQAVPEDAVGILQKSDPGVAMKAFNEQWENLMAALGKPVVKQVAETLNSLAAGMNSLAQIIDAHPDLAKTFVGAMAGIAAGLGALAVVGLAMFAPGGIAVVALVTFAGALAGMAAVNWDKIQGMSQAMGLSMDTFHKNIADISGAFDQINAALTSFFTGLVAIIRQIPVLGRMLPAEKGKEEFGPNLPPGMGGKALGMDPSDGPSGFIPMAYRTGGAANDNVVKKAAEDFGTLKEKTGLVNISFDGVTTKSTALAEGFTNVGTGSAAFKNALDILTATAMGAARALATVAMSGGGMGGGGGFTNASWGGGGFGGGGGPINPGQHGWWTMDRQSHAVDVLMKGGVSELGAKALVSRWMNVEAGGGPSTVNGIGAAGIGQWLGNRRNGLPSDFDGQLHHALKELHGSEGRALGMLNSGTALGAATGASQYERAEGYNPRTGMDNFTARTLRGIGSVPTAGAPPRRVTPGSPATPAAGATSASNGGPSHVHVAVHLDKKVIARETVKLMASSMAFPTSMGGPNARAHYTSPGTGVTDAA